MDSYRLGELKYAFFSGTGRKTKKLQRSNLFPAKGIEIFYTATQAIYGWKALDLGSLNMQFQQDAPRDKKLQLFKFFAQNLENFRLTELYDAPLEGSAIFL